MSNLSTTSVAALQLDPTASTGVRRLCFAAFGLGLFALGLLPLAMPWKLAGGLLLSAAVLHGWRRHPALGAPRPRVRLEADGRWLWQQGEECEEVELLADSYHMPFLVILNFRTRARAVRSLLLTRDNIDADTFRRLKCHLKTSPTSATT